MAEFISWGEAFARVGREKYGSHWIGRLTEREQYLIDQYCDVPVAERSSILPGHAVWTRRKLRPLGATLEDEVGRADDRRRWKVIQDEYVTKWLTDHGFSHPRVCLFDLERKLQEQFGVDDCRAEHESLSVAGKARPRIDLAPIDGGYTVSHATVAAPVPGTDDCEAKSKDSAATLDCTIVEPHGAVWEPHRPYKLSNVRPRNELSGRVWDFFKALEQKGQLQPKKQKELHRLIHDRFSISGEEVMSRRTMRRILGLNADS
jgi:hypothetical protein